MLEKVLIDEAIEVLLELAGHFGRPTGTGAIRQPRDALLVKAMHPLAQRRIIGCVNK